MSRNLAIFPMWEMITVFAVIIVLNHFMQYLSRINGRTYKRRQPNSKPCYFTLPFLVPQLRRIIILLEKVIIRFTGWQLSWGDLILLIYRNEEGNHSLYRARLDPERAPDILGKLILLTSGTGKCNDSLYRMILDAPASDSYLEDT